MGNVNVHSVGLGSVARARVRIMLLESCTERIGLRLELGARY